MAVRDFQFGDADRMTTDKLLYEVRFVIAFLQTYDFGRCSM